MGTWNYLWHYIFLVYLCAEATTTLGEGTRETPTTARTMTKGPNSTAPDSSSGTTEASSDATSHSFVSQSWTPGITSIGSGAMEAQTMISSPALTTTGPKPWNSAASTSPDSDTTSNPAPTITSPKPWNSAPSTSPDSDTTSSPAPTITSPKPWNSAASISPDSDTTPNPAPTITSPKPWNSAASMSPDSDTISNPAPTITSPKPWNSAASMSPDSDTTSNPAPTITSPRPWNSAASTSPDSDTTSNPAPTITSPKPWNSAASTSPDSDTTSSPAPTITSPKPWNSAASTSPDSDTTSNPAPTITSPKPWNSAASTSPDSDTTSNPAPTITSPKPWNSAASMSPDSDTTSNPAPTITSPRPWNSAASTSPDSDTTSNPAPTITSPRPWNSAASTSPDSDTTSNPAPTITSPKPWNSAASMSPDSDTTQTSLVPTMVVSVTTPALLLTSRPLTQGQTTGEVAATSSSTGNPLTAASMASSASHATTPSTDDKSPIMNQGTGMTTEPNAKTSLSTPDTSLIPSTTRTADGQGRTETMATTPALEHSSLGVSARSEATSLTLSPTRSNTTATASGSAASMSLSTGLPVTTHASSTPAGSSFATHSSQHNSTSDITEAGLDATSHTSTSVASSTTSSTPGITSIGSGAVTAEMFSPAPSSHSIKPSVSTAETQPALLTSRPFTQGQVTVEAGNISSSTGTPLPAVSTASAASHATTHPDEGKSAITDQGSSTAAEPKASTSLSLAATSLVTEFMTNFTESTSANPSLTCLPVSIEVQNVTGKAIQLSWTGGGRDSLYTISLMYENQKINVTRTHETKMMFENLLPGRVYKISVAASSCAESAVSVRTDSASCSSRNEICSPQNTGCDDLKSLVCSDYQAFACSVLFTNQTFNHALYNSESEDFKAMSEMIKKEVVEEMRMKLHDDHFDIVVLGFKPGSVIADCISVLQKQELVDVNVFQTQLNQVLNSKFGEQANVTVQSFSTQSSTETSSSWKVAVIVLGVLLGVALVLLLLETSVCIYMKKRSGKYVVDHKGLLGNSAYKHL